MKTQSHMDAMKGHETVKRREKRARQVKVGPTSGSAHSGTLGPLDRVLQRTIESLLARF